MKWVLLWMTLVRLRKLVLPSKAQSVLGHWNISRPLCHVVMASSISPSPWFLPSFSSSAICWDSLAIEKWGCRLWIWPVKVKIWKPLLLGVCQSCCVQNKQTKQGAWGKLTIGANFRVAFRLCFKARPNAKPFKISFIHMHILVHLHVNKANLWKASH